MALCWLFTENKTTVAGRQGQELGYVEPDGQPDGLSALEPVDFVVKMCVVVPSPPPPLPSIPNCSSLFPRLPLLTITAVSGASTSKHKYNSHCFRLRKLNKPIAAVMMPHKISLVQSFIDKFSFSLVQAAIIQ